MKKFKLCDYSLCHIIIAALYTIAILLLVAGFILPPPGQIDNSVLVASGILFAFAGLTVILFAIRKKIHTSFDYKDVHIEVGDKDLQ